MYHPFLKVLVLASIRRRVIKKRAQTVITLWIKIACLPSNRKARFAEEPSKDLSKKSESQFRNKVVPTTSQWMVKLISSSWRQSFKETYYQIWTWLKKWAYFPSWKTCIVMLRKSSVGERERGWEKRMEKIRSIIQMLSTQTQQISLIMQRYLIPVLSISKMIRWLHNSLVTLSG